MAADRIVVKLGSSVVTLGEADHLAVDRNTIFQLAEDMAHAAQRGVQIVVVSSGAVALGMEEMGVAARPEALEEIQALAALGQGLLMQLWREAFGRYQLRVGQILLTHRDLAARPRFLNVRATLEALLGMGAIPIVNENDSVMTDEITVGDNDTLAAQVAKLVGADRLLLLSSVSGLLDSQGQLVEEVQPGDAAEALVMGNTSATGRGGMGSKVAAARATTHGGIEVVIAHGKSRDIVCRTLDGEPVGTRFLPRQRTIPSRKYWIAYTLKPRGIVVLDDGAVQAVESQGASVLAIGVSRVEGVFDAGDPVLLVSPAGREIGRGLVRMSSEEIKAALGQRGPTVIHRDDLVVETGRGEGR